MTAGVVLVAAAAGLLSFVAVGVWRGVAQRYGLLDVPNERSAHAQPTPRAGGIAIVLATIIGLLVLWIRNPQWNARVVGAYAASALAVAGLSLRDDVTQLGPSTRLVGQLACVVVLLLGVGFWASLSVPLLGDVRLGLWGVGLSLIWALGLLNAYNFMDGIDGIAGIQAVVAGAAWTACGWLIGDSLVTSIAVLIAASSLGFLAHNWAPARVFMGDVGSVFLGFSFAALPLMAVDAEARLPVVGVLVVWPFVFDTIFTMVRRVTKGEVIWKPHRSHLYQRLLPLGYSHRFVSLVYAVLASTGAVLGVLWLSGAPGAGPAIAITTPAMAAGLWRFVVRQETAGAGAAVVAD